MKYISEFADINNKIYRIEILTLKGEGEKELVLSGTPFTTEMKSDGLYSPIKCSGATITLLTKDIPFDIYSGSSLGTKITVTSGSDVIWIGYLTPCVYSLGFDEELEEIELECIDGISVLKEIPYKSEDKEIKFLLDIVVNCLELSDCYKYLYVSNNLQLDSTLEESIMERLRISENNFFDEKDYELQPDKEVAWNCYDVLFEIMLYLGYSLISEGDSIYIVDYDAIIKDKNEYYKYDLSDLSSSLETISHSYFINGDSYSENGSQIELTEVYNKLSVKDEFYTIESIFENLYEDKNWINITANEDPKLLSWLDGDVFYESDVFTVKNKAGEDESFYIVLKRNWRWDLFMIICKFYKNPMIKTYHYFHTLNLPYFPEVYNETKFTDVPDAKGAYLIGLYVKHIEWNTYEEWKRKYRYINAPIQNWKPELKLKAYGELVNLAKIENKKLEKYIVCTNPLENHINHDQVKDYPYFSITKNLPSIFGGVDAYIIISGSLFRHLEDENFWSMSEHHTYNEKNTSIYVNESYLWALLKWGDYYWDNATDWDRAYFTLNGTWVKVPTYFRLYYGNNQIELKSEVFYDKELSIEDTAGRIWGISGEKGYYVPAPKEGNLAGDITLTVFANKDTKGKWGRVGHTDKKNSYETYPPRIIVYKDLDVKVGFADDALNEDAAKEDTVYTNEVEDYVNVNEGEEITCKICTFDNKTPSYSVVDYLDEDGNSLYLDKLHSKSTNVDLRAEEHLIYKQVNQFEEPKVSYKANLKNNLGLKPYSVLTDKTLAGKKFVLDSVNRDYRFNKAEVVLIEKNDSYK